MSGKMWRLRFTKLLTVAFLLVAIGIDTRAQGGRLAIDEIRASRIQRDLDGVTTVLLVSARPGKAVPPVGLLTKTARTFVQDGASTEYATQVLGTTLDNGRLYARILSTSSRVFYDKEPSPDTSGPYVVYPSKAPQNDWRFGVALDDVPIKAIGKIEVSGDGTNAGASIVNAKTGRRENEVVDKVSPPALDELLERENDVFNKRELSGEPNRFKPAKVRPAEFLPTYTVKQDYSSGNFDAFEEEQPKSFRPRAPKIFRPQSKVPPKKQEVKPLETVTYHGFADFTTTVGDTVIVFSPSTSPAPPGRPATTIKGDATLRPNDGVAMEIRPTNVVPGRTKTELPGLRKDQPPPRKVDRTMDDPLLEAINAGNLGNLQPSVVAEPEVESLSSSDSTTPLVLVPEVETILPKPTGLLKTVDSTTAFDGTTTHYKSLIYGTYIGTNYAQIIHTSSNVYFFPDEATVTYGSEETTSEYSPTDAEYDVPEQETTGTTPRVATTTGEVTPEMNELTSPFKDTTDNVLTTLKNILENSRKGHGTTEPTVQTVPTVPTTESEITNDILPADPQGRSIQSGGSSKNNLDSEEKKRRVLGSHSADSEKERPTLATRLLPSTVYKTFTYFTTFFIPDGDDRTTTSIKSREVVSSEVTHLTELILPSATIEPSTRMTSVLSTTKVEESSMTSKIETSSGESEEEQTTKQDEEIELIFKTLYTTYTYLTTFFQESTSSVSSREVVETNVITQTVGPNGVSADVAGLFDRDESVLISPTKVPKVDLASATSIPSRAEEEKREEDTSEDPRVTVEETTEGLSTTLEDQDQDWETTVEERGTTESMLTESDVDADDEFVTDLEPSPTPMLATKNSEAVVKTYYTTYTYFTTIFVDDETEIETRTEVFTNVITEGIQPTTVVPIPEQIESTTTLTTTTTSEPEITEKPAVPPEILAYLAAIQKQKSQEEALLLAKKVQEEANSAETTEILGETTVTEGTTEIPTILEEQAVTEKMFTSDSEVNSQLTPNPPIDGEVLGSMITDVLSSSSSGGGMVLDMMDKRNVVPEDQELSESNNHEVEPAPTLLLQTSYTTFTYFTTMYKGDDSNVASRLETVTNIVTETILPSAVLPAETSTLPVTYFTTFTYWTTFYKGGDTVTTSREETVSNVVTPGVVPMPTSVLESNVIVATNGPTTTLPSVEKNLTEKESTEVTSPGPSDTDKSVTEQSSAASSKDITTISETEKEVNGSTISPDPTTFYTTFTYFTTSYVGNETVLNSRLETVTSVVHAADVGNRATGRAIGGPVPGVQVINTEENAPATSTLIPSKVKEDAPKTGLISTIRSSQVNDGTTTHFLTDVYGTYIDGLYAQVVESSTKLETPGLSSSATPVLPTGVLSLNRGSIVDADEVTTVYFTTQQIGTLIDGLYAKVIESTSSTKIDEERKASVNPIQGHRTGLVRLIQGYTEANDTTTYYQSKVIGTSIDGRYAQIIESTSSFLAPGASATSSITPTSVVTSSLATGAPEISPSPAVIQSSLSEDPTTEASSQEEEEEETDQSEEDEEDGESDEDGQRSKKKSRLTFSTRKRTFTPVIRPFASRNRPTFNPKRKGAQGATTITRTDITPTITATLAGKGNRFASSRSRVSSPIGPYSSTLSPSGSRRFSGRRSSSASANSASNSGYSSGSTRGRASSRIAPSSVFPGGRRGSSSVRGSSARAGPRGSSSIHPGASSRYRPGIRPSSTLLRGQSTVRHEDQEDNANEFTTTTLVTEETPYTEEEDDGETVTAPLQTTTESSRRTTNPLLRFRRPLTLGNNSARSSTTTRSPPTTARRPSNLSRQSSPTVASRSTNGRPGSRPSTPIVTARPRQSQNGLFPPRGLFNRKPEPTEEPVEIEEEFEGGEDEENFEDEPLEEIADNDYEGSEHEDTHDNANRRSGKNIGPVVQIRPFTSFGRPRRFRRQASQLRSLTNRFRRPGQSSAQVKTEEKTDGEAATSKEETSKSPVSKPTSRYSSRTRSSSSSRPNSGSRKTSNGSGNKSSEPTEAPATEQQHQAVKPRTRSKSSGNRNSSPRVKPSPATSSSGRQFTLREKDSSGSARSGYKRPSTSGSRSRSSAKTENVARPRPPRLRSGSSKPQNEAASSSPRRLSPSRSSSRSSSNRNTGRRVPSQRNRGNSHEDIRESPFVEPEFDGTITVTHYVPTEVTIPVVNNGVTEQRNIVTAQPSTEILSPEQYSTVVGGDGRPLVVIVSEVTGTNLQGQMEVTRFLLHETPTTRVSHTLTTLGGRRASQSVIVPSTVYSVENVVSTVQPSLPSGNAPLANILLSQLLLGQLGQQNPLLGGLQQPQGTPTTQYNTRTTSYVTTITKHQSTVIPLTFRGKEILTTLVDSSTDVVTATEFITDTVVVTPTAALPGANLNSLLLLLQQPQQQQSNPLDPLFAAAPLLTQSNTLPGEVERRHQPADSDYKPLSYDYSEEEFDTPVRSRGRKNNKSNGRKEETSVSSAEMSVVTLYVSGRRPGEFSTVLSTVKVGEDATASRRRRNVDTAVQASRPPPSLHAAPEAIAVLAGSEEPIDAHAPTQSLESVVDKFQDSTSTLRDDRDPSITSSEDGTSEESNSQIPKRMTNSDTEEVEEEEEEEEPRERVRVHVPVVRNKSDGQHKYTVVRRRPLVPYTREALSKITPHASRRIVVTRVRTLGPANALRTNDNSESESLSTGNVRHKVTVTRRRKIGPSSIATTVGKARLTRKKLLTVRPIVSLSPTLAIITTGFFTASSSNDDEDYTSEEDFQSEDPSIPTPDLEDTPNAIDNKPEETLDDSEAPSKFQLELPEDPVSQNEPVIITDHFFLPPSNSDEEEYKSDYVEQDAVSEDGSKEEETSTSIDSTDSIEDEDTILDNSEEPSSEKSSDIETSFVKTIDVDPTEPTAKAFNDSNSDSKTIESNDTIVQSIQPTNVISVLASTESSYLPTQPTSSDDDIIDTDVKVSPESPREETETDVYSDITTTTIPNTSFEIPTIDNSSGKPIEPVDSKIELPIAKLPTDDLNLATSTRSSASSETPNVIEIESSIDTVLPTESPESSLTLNLDDITKPNDISDSDVPTVIPLDSESTIDSNPTSTLNPEISSQRTSVAASQLTTTTTTYTSPTPEDIEAGLADELYLSLSRPDLSQILPSKPTNDLESSSHSQIPGSIAFAPVPSTSVYYTETIVTSTRLRTYTYVVTKLNGPETEVTSSTTVRPRVTTLTLTVPVTVTIAPTAEPSLVSPVHNPESAVDERAMEDEDEGRRFNLATRVMSNGVEVIVAGPTPALRWENSSPQPTLTLSDTVVMLLPRDKPHEFVTKTCTTTFTYLNTITKDGTTIVSTDQQVVANTATEERHRKPASEAADVTLEASPTLRTEVFKTTYTYLTLNTDHPDAENALESSIRVIANTVTAPQHYLDMILEPSEVPRPETNTYLSTRMLEKTFTEDGRTRIETSSDTVTQLIITESAPPPRPTSVTTTLTALDNTDDTTTDAVKTYYITYTYFSTFLDKGSTVVHTNIATSSDIVTERMPIKKTTTKTVSVNPTPEPIQIFATKTYLTTFTYFTTLLQAGPNGETSTTVSSRSQIVENVVTESIAPSLLDAGYMNALLTTAHHSDSVKNVVTGSTIIFFDEEDRIDPTTTMSGHEATDSAVTETNEKKSESSTTVPVGPTSASNSAGGQMATTTLINQVGNATTTSTSDSAQTKRPSASQSSGDLQVSNLLSLGSLGINSLSALGPVITAMAGLLQGKTSAVRRNDTASTVETQEVTTQRSPIYIPVAEFADGDIETAESQNIAAHLANLNHNYLPETRHKVAASLADGIPISPGEVITANSDVIIGKPGKMGPRPPQTFLKEDEHIGMKPPPLPVPNVPVHPIHEVLQNYHEDSQSQQTLQGHQGPQLQILSAHQVYEEHQKIPVAPSVHLAPKHPQKLHPIRATTPKRTGNNHDIMENDPLLKPPGRPNVEQYVNPNVNVNEPDWSPEKYRRPWSAKDPLESSQHWLENVANAPADFDELHGESSAEIKPRPKVPSSGQHKRPPWTQKDPAFPNIPVVIETSETMSKPSEPIVHHKVPHVIDRSTGQPLLVNIQPSQMANVVIPQGGTQALIFGDTNEPHISGQYFDDPSPYPEPEVGPGFVGIEKVEDLPQFSKGNDPADYMVPPLASVNFNPPSHKQHSTGTPHTIPLSHSQTHLDVFESHGGSEVSLPRPEKRPEIHLIQRPDNPGIPSGQGHVHTEILVHHRPETVNIRPQSIPHPPILSHVNSGHPLPPRRDYSKPQRPTEPSPPRRTEMPVPTEIPHRYIFLGKPSDSGNEVTINPGWKPDKKPARIPLPGRPRPSVRPRPPPVRTTAGPHNHLIYVERLGGYPGRKPQYPGPQRPPLKSQGNFAPPNWSSPNSQSSQEPSKNHVPNTSHDVVAENYPEDHGQFSHHSQVDLQDRPPHLYSENTNSESSTTTDSQVAHVEEHVPTGAIGYHNPSSDLDVKPEDAQYYPQVPTFKPEVQSFGQILPQPDKEPENWQVNTQTEKMLIDSVAGESENVKFQNDLHDDEDKKKHGETDQNDVVISVNSRPVDGNVSLQIKNSYDTVGTINTVVGKPLGIEQGITYGQNDQKPFTLNQGVPFGYHNNEAPIVQGVPFVPDRYNARPYETPIVQGKPFGVYNGFVDIVKPYGYNQKNSKPEYEIVQGVPFGHYGNQKPPLIHRPSQVGHVSTSKPYERDDTIDLKPPAIIPQFGPDPGRPYSRPSGPLARPESGLAVYSRPDVINTKIPDTFDIGPDHGDHIVKRPEIFESNVGRPNLGQKLPSAYGNGQISLEFDGINSGHPIRPGDGQINSDWGTNVQLSEDDQSQHSVRPEYRPEYDSQANDNGTLQDGSRNQTIVRPGHGESFVHLEGGVKNSRPETNVPASHPEQGLTTQVHPEYPQIITKPRPRVPIPITISSGSTEPESNGRPNIQFSLPVEATGEEKDSKTQTERPPSMLVTKNTLKKKQNEETLETAYQTNFAVSDVEDDDYLNRETETKIRPGDTLKQETTIGLQKQRPPYQDMMPPPFIDINDRFKDESDREGLKPPPLPSDVLGLSPPPVVITTTNGQLENGFPFATESATDLRPPPKYIPLEESIGIVTPPPPSISMVPPSPRPTLARPFIVELLSQDMVPPPPAMKTSRPLEIATVRPAVAVSGSIQIATAVATSQIPVVQDIESKIPIIHGTVDLPVVVDVPEILRPVETRKSEHVSIYTVRPFETRPVSRISVQRTAMLTTSPTPAKSRPAQTDHIEPSRPSITHQIVKPTRLPSAEISNKFTKGPFDRPTFIEASEENALPSTRVEATESLTYILDTNKAKKHQTSIVGEEVTMTRKSEIAKSSSRNDTKIDIDETPTIVTRVDSSITKVTNTLVPRREHSKVKDTSVKATKEIVGTVIRQVAKDGSTATMEMKPKEVTHYKTLTVTRTETSVLGSPPTTRTLLLTHTLTSTTVETVTETLLRSTSVVATVTSTVLQSVTRIPSSYDNAADNDSIFVVLSDQKPPVPNAEEVEAEYGEEDISRDEQDPGGNEIHRVLAGGILGAPVIPLQPIDKRCMPECKASKAEICAEVDVEMRCICRPGFARMFPDRPCKPTYTYTLRVGLDRIGRNPIIYEIALNDSASTAYKRLASPTKDALDRTLMQSDLRDLYRGLNIAGFTPDPTAVEFHVQLSDNANEIRLKEVLKKYLVGSNFSLGGTDVYATRDLDLIDARDFDECATEEGGPHHDCSQNAACFNLRGSYQCSCKEGWADLSENPTYPGRVCSQAPLGCVGCNNKGHCVINTNGHEVCECFPWHGGQRCQVNLKVLLIALVTTGAILLGLLAVCVGLACFRRPSRRFKSGDRRAMIPGTGGDTSSEGSLTDLAIPHHVPHVLPPPPQTIAPAPPTKKPARKISGKPRRPLRKPSVPISVPGPLNDDQRDRSLTVMIPRAKYRSAPQSPQNYKPVMSTFAVDEHKLIGYLEGGPHPGNRKPSVSSNKDYKEAELQIVRTPVAPSGALVSAGFQVSATVTRPIDAESTLARSCGETTVEPPTKLLRNTDLQGDLGSTLARSCGETTIQAPTKLLRLDLGETGSTLARSCGETTIQTATKVAANRRNSAKEARDNASDGHTMAERDLGSTLRLQAQHPPLYNPDRASDRESNFDSL